ncbi:hypothetical protein BX666DRAFT_2025513 [Dichotomocladium elegans]|nr:hypothetical protein BX666DRAFT_2025513 [Dichotomocladium elegans]
MSVAGSTSSRGTTKSRSRSRSRSRSPSYSDGRYAHHRYNVPRYDSYFSYRLRSQMPAPMEDYRDLRDRDRIVPRDDRYPPRSRERDARYSRYYRDEMPPSHYYSPSSMPPSREYAKYSSNSFRREPSLDQSKDNKNHPPIPSNGRDAKEDGNSGSASANVSSSIGVSTNSRQSSGSGVLLDSYTPTPPRYNDWHRDRDRERERERRYREDDHRWRDLRDRDNYIGRYESSAYGNPPPPAPPPPLAPPYAPPFGGDSYRPDRDRDRDIPPSPSAPHPYYDRERLDDRDFYRPMPRNSLPLESERFRRPIRTWGPSNRERDRESSTKSPRGSAPLGSIPPWATPRSRDEIQRQEGSRDGIAQEKQQPSEKQNDHGAAAAAELHDSSKLIRDQGEPGKKTDLMDDSNDKRPIPPTPEAGTKEPDTSQPVEKDGQIPAKQLADDHSRQKTVPDIAAVDTKPANDHLREMPLTSPVEQEALSPTRNTDISPATADEGQDQLGEKPKQSLPSNVESEITHGIIFDNDSLLDRELTQQKIVERIGQIENDITMYEEMLEEVIKRDEQSKQERSSESGLAGADDLQQEEDEEQEAAKQQALQVISEGTQSAPRVDIENLSLRTSPIMRKKPQLLINQIRSYDETDDMLCEKLLMDNNKTAKESSAMCGGWQGRRDDPETWTDESEWKKPLYTKIEDYPCFKDNVKNFTKVKMAVAVAIVSQKQLLEQKEIRLKREYKRLYESWKKRNLALDRIREQESRSSDKFGRSGSRRRGDEEAEDNADGVVFNSEHDVLRFGAEGAGTPYYNGSSKRSRTSDAVRSEAELLEIIQSLETADMRNPELRAAKTTATIPPMILDVKERMRTFDDRSGLVLDPMTYYHTGHDTEDNWTQQEMIVFMESYMQYPKQFDKIAAAIGTKTAPQCVLLYYRKKKKIDFKALVNKGRRGKAAKRRDRLAEAIRRATGGSDITTLKAKSKGSSLMTDIGEAQVTRRAKQKESERKSRELRDLEEANAYWDGVNERRRMKRPNATGSNAQLQQQQQQSSSSSLMSAPGVSTEDTRDRRRFSRRKGRSPRVLGDTNEDPYVETEEGDVMDRGLAPTAKWTEKDKQAAVEAFKQHGRNFVHVASLVGTKTEDQCRNFYHNFKRKYGPNAFDEESDISLVATSEGETLAPLASGVLKADEQDVAATLMGMSEIEAAKPVSGHIRTMSTQFEDQKISESSSDSGVRQQHRRARTSSGKVIDKSMLEEWMDAEFSGRNSTIANGATGRRSGRIASTSLSCDTPRRPAYSSYWSVSERKDFLQLLEKYGRDWDKLSSALVTKTAIQVRNFYMNNNDKMQLDKIVKRHLQAKQKQEDEQQQQQSALSQMAGGSAGVEGEEYPAPTKYSEVPGSSKSTIMYQTRFPSLAEATEQHQHRQQRSASPFVATAPPPLPHHVGHHSPTPPPPLGPRVGYFSPQSPSSSVPPSPASVPPRQHSQPSHSVMIHGYGPNPYAPPTSSSYTNPAHHHRTHPLQHPIASVHEVVYPSHPLHPVGPPPVATAPAVVTALPQQRSPYRAVTSNSETTSSVTKVADLLNNDEPADQSKSWESWFS